MHINRSVKPQQQRIKHYASTSDAFSFFNQLTSPELLDTLEITLPEHRERLFPPTETLSMFLAQALKPDRSCQSIVNDAAVKRLTSGLPSCSTNTGAYCKARQRLPVEMVSTLVRHTGSLIGASAHQTWLWNRVTGSVLTFQHQTFSSFFNPRRRYESEVYGVAHNLLGRKRPTRPSLSLYYLIALDFAFVYAH